MFETIKNHKTSIILNFYLNKVIWIHWTMNSKMGVCAWMYCDSVHSSIRKTFHRFSFENNIFAISSLSSHWPIIHNNITSVNGKRTTKHCTTEIRLLLTVRTCFCFRSLIFTAILSLCCVLSCVINGFGWQITMQPWHTKRNR